ncbi:MAG: hypothetical protein IPK97_18195 [Ahniella sp.]|nr:hypothetical protein [Ahniella sp.]
MNEWFPASIGSVATQWVEAWRMPMYRIPEPSFDEAVLARFDDPSTEQHLRMAAGSSASILSVALMVALRGEDDARVRHIAARVAGSAEQVESALKSGAGGFADAGLEAPMRLAFAACVATPSLPAAKALSEPARCAVRDLAKHKGPLHPTVERRLRLAAFGALLAQDAELLAAVVALVPAATRSASAQWALHERILAIATPHSGAGSFAEAVKDTEVRTAFEQQWIRHRQPILTIGPGDETPVDVPFVLGNYLHCWAWLSVFSETPVSRVDWTTMRGLMMG